MLHFGKELIEKCHSALLKICGGREDFFITLDGNFPAEEIISVLDCSGEIKKIIVWERGTEKAISFWPCLEEALISFFWFVSHPYPTYATIYRDHGVGVTDLSDSEQIKAFLFSCEYCGVDSGKFSIEGFAKKYELADGALRCVKRESIWEIQRVKISGYDEVGRFTSINHALYFMFWTLTNVRRYDEVQE